MSRISRLALVLAIAAIVPACGGSNNDPFAGPSPPPSLGIPFSTTDLVVGTGAEAQNGRRVTVDYTGWLYVTTTADNKGTQFDTSIGRTPLVRPVLGGGGVIVGFDRGIIGMRVGGKRRVIIPPELGYGTAGSGTAIPGNATLIFELDLLSVQ